MESADAEDAARIVAADLLINWTKRASHAPVFEVPLGRWAVWRLCEAVLGSEELWAMAAEGHCREPEVHDEERNAPPCEKCQSKDHGAPECPHD